MNSSPSILVSMNDEVLNKDQWPRGLQAGLTRLDHPNHPNHLRASHVILVIIVIIIMLPEVVGPPFDDGVCVCRTIIRSDPHHFNPEIHEGKKATCDRSRNGRKKGRKEKREKEKRKKKKGLPRRVSVFPSKVSCTYRVQSAACIWWKALLPRLLLLLAACCLRTYVVNRCGTLNSQSVACGNRKQQTGNRGVRFVSDSQDIACMMQRSNSTLTDEKAPTTPSLPPRA